MAIDLQHSIEIARPAREVYSYLSNVENNPAWQHNVLSCRWTSDDHWSVGATYVQEEAFMGRGIETHYRVTEYERSRLVSFESMKRSSPIQISLRIESLGDTRCRIAADYRGLPTGLSRIFAGMPTISVDEDYQRLKGLLESL